LSLSYVSLLHYAPILRKLAVEVIQVLRYTRHKKAWRWFADSGLGVLWLVTESFGEARGVIGYPTAYEGVLFIFFQPDVKTVISFVYSDIQSLFLRWFYVADSAVFERNIRQPRCKASHAIVPLLDDWPVGRGEQHAYPVAFGGR
jgi:hypothetical protein